MKAPRYYELYSDEPIEPQVDAKYSLTQTSYASVQPNPICLKGHEYIFDMNWPMAVMVIGVAWAIAWGRAARKSGRGK